MPTFTADRTYEIFLGEATAETEDITLVPIESSGNATARRRLVYPNNALAPIVYETNPTRTLNFDQDVLFAPISNVERMLTGSKVIQFDTAENDVVITETWTAREGQIYSMITSFFRMLREYHINPPAFSATNQEYIQWFPADRTTDGYNVLLHRLVVGGGQENNQLYDINDIRPRGGFNDPWGNGANATAAGPLDFISEGVTGVLDRTVIFQFKIVNKIGT